MSDDYDAGKYPVRYLPIIYLSRYLPGSYMYLKNLTES